jgi:hypothetical protein
LVAWIVGFNGLGSVQQQRQQQAKQAAAKQNRPDAGRSSQKLMLQVGNQRNQRESKIAPTNSWLKQKQSFLRLSVGIYRPPIFLLSTPPVPQSQSRSIEHCPFINCYFNLINLSIAVI